MQVWEGHGHQRSILEANYKGILEAENMHRGKLGKCLCRLAFK